MTNFLDRTELNKVLPFQLDVEDSEKESMVIHRLDGTGPAVARITRLIYQRLSLYSAKWSTVEVSRSTTPRSHALTWTIRIEDESEELTEKNCCLSIVAKPGYDQHPKFRSATEKDFKTS